MSDILWAIFLALMSGWLGWGCIVLWAEFRRDWTEYKRTKRPPD